MKGYVHTRQELTTACRRYDVPELAWEGWDVDWLISTTEERDSDPWKIGALLTEIIDAPTPDDQRRDRLHSHHIRLLQFWLKWTWATPLGLAPTAHQCSDLAWRRVAGKGGLRHRRHGVFDHDRTFKTAGRLRATDAFVIASNPYGPRKKEAIAFAEQVGCDVEFPDFPSWWYPGSTTLITFTNRQ
jgi:hypothetical protein